MAKVVITQPIPAGLLELWRATLGIGEECAMVSSLDKAELAELAGEAEVLVNLYRRVNSRLLQLTPRVRFIQQLSAGYNHIDLEAVAQAGILFAATPGANAKAVAEHTLLLMLSLLKRFVESEQMARAGHWDSQLLAQAGIGDLATATVGLVGLGAIGQAVAQRLSAFGSRVVYFTRNRLDQATEEHLGVSYMTLLELLATSSIVSLHLPLNSQTRHIIGERELAQMQPGAFLVNTSRGELINEQALHAALVQDSLAGAALDVLEHEVDGGNIFANLPQVIITPHTAGLSRAAVANIMQMGMSNVARFLRGEQPQDLVYEWW